MTRIHPASIALSPDELPRADLNVREVRAILRRAGIDAAQHGGIISLLQRTMEDYAMSRLVDARGATPAQVRAYVRALGRTLKQLVSLTASTHPVGQALIGRAYASGTMPVGLAADLAATLQKFSSGVMSAAAATTDAQTESGKMAEAARHRKLAEGMLRGFANAGWPIDLESDNGLLFQLFVICLEAVGEKQTRPKRVFDKVAESIISGQTMQ